MVRKAATVRGLVDASTLGLTLPHEHLLIDFTCRYAAALDEGELAPQPRLEDRWKLLRNPAGYLVNLTGGDIEEAVGECSHFSRAGGRTIVDLTPTGLSPDPVGLKEISERTGLNVIAATGYYIDGSLPDWVRHASVEKLADHLVEDLTNGGPEAILRGAIGEIAVESGSELELRCIRAAGIAQKRTGAPCFFHVMSGILPEFRDLTDELIAIYLHEGGSLEKLVLCHQDGSGTDPSYQDRLLKSGIWLEYDTFGSEGVFAFGETYIQLPTDSQRIREVAALVDRGWLGRILISHDVCYRTAKRCWGGSGMAHILDVLRPRFAAVGVGEEILMKLLTDNPANLFGYID